MLLDQTVGRTERRHQRAGDQDLVRQRRSPEVWMEQMKWPKTRKNWLVCACAQREGGGHEGNTGLLNAAGEERESRVKNYSLFAVGIKVYILGRSNLHTHMSRSIQ